MKKDEIYNFISKEISVRIVTSADVNSSYLSTLRDKESLMYLGNARENLYDKKLLVDYVNEQNHSTDSYLFGLYHKGYLVATSRVHDISEGSCWQGVLVFIGQRKKGYGTILVKNVAQFMIEQFNLNTIKAGILESNIASQNLFYKAGFRYKSHDKSTPCKQIWFKSVSHYN